MKWGVKAFATVGLAASGDAAASLFGDNWFRDRRYRVLHCGIDLTEFSEDVDRCSVRAELGISDGAFVVGHVGSFSIQKNHRFLLEVFHRIHAACPSSVLLLIGSGPLLDEVRRRALEAGLQESVKFAWIAG